MEYVVAGAQCEDLVVSRLFFLGRRFVNAAEDARQFRVVGRPAVEGDWLWYYRTNAY
jgi:hypothetical protein